MDSEVSCKKKKKKKEKRVRDRVAIGQSIPVDAHLALHALRKRSALMHCTLRAFRNLGKMHGKCSSSLFCLRVLSIHLFRLASVRSYI